jgi:glycosyltransferase involved in cell wall biosynthesis
MPQHDHAILINGRFLMQPVTGVQRVARELLSEFDRLVGEGSTPLRLALACEPAADVSGLGLRHIPVERRGGAGGHAWEQLVLPTMAAGRRLLCLGNTAPVLSALASQRLAVMIHDVSYLSWPHAYSRRYRLAHRTLLPFLLRRADPLFTVSTAEGERLRRLHGAAGSRILAIQNGGWSGDRIEHHTTPVRERMVLYVGSLSRRKNVERVIAVAQRLAREEGIRTILVGASHDILTPVRASVDPDVAHMLEFVGQVPSLEALAQYYRRAACLLFPSLYEASPLPPVEAMSLGCPVVASAIPAMTERCGDAAQYCDPLDIGDIVAAVLRVIDDPEFAQGLRQRGFARAATYSWRGQARTILDAMTAS